MDKLVISLCTLSSIMCAILLLRGYRRNHSKLLLRSGICFALLAITNALLFADRFLTPIDLGPIRSIITLLAVVILLAGLISEAS